MGRSARIGQFPPENVPPAPRARGRPCRVGVAATGESPCHLLPCCRLVVPWPRSRRHGRGCAATPPGAAASSSRLEPVQATAMLRVRTPGDRQPFGVREPDAGVKGIEVGPKGSLASSLGAKPAGVKTTWARRQPDLSPTAAASRSVSFRSRRIGKGQRSSADLPRSTARRPSRAARTCGGTRASRPSTGPLRAGSSTRAATTSGVMAFKACADRRLYLAQAGAELPRTMDRWFG